MCWGLFFFIVFVFLLFLFHYGLSQAIEYSSQCCTVGTCCLSILYIEVYIYESQTPSPSHLHRRPFPLATKSLFSVSVSILLFCSVQFSSVAQSCLSLCNPMNCSTPGLPVHHQLPEFTQTHVHRVGDAIQPSHPLSSPSPPAPDPSQHQSLFQ